VVGLLGGSFDPVHHGHLVTAVVLREELGLDEVRLVPARAQPFKAGHGAPVEDRLRMLELAVADCAGLAVEPIEVRRPGPSYTVDTLRLLGRREPAESWTLLVGSDAATEFAAWREHEAIMGLARVVFFSRAGQSPPALAGTDHVSVPGLDISATAVRERVARGRTIRYWVPDSVAEYIATHRLYMDTEV